MFVFCCCCILVYIHFDINNDILVQNSIIDNLFSVDSYSDEYLGFIEVPRLSIKRLIKRGTDSIVLDNGYVGLYNLRDDLSSHNLVVLAGHNTFNVFGKLHDILVGDSVYISGNSFNRKFIVYDKLIVKDDDFSYFSNRINELLLITCTDDYGYRLLVFLREDL